MSHDCENLDAFLVDDLPSDAADRFAGHIARCATCREAVDQQRWIDGLLTSPVREELELPRADVLAAVRASIVQRRRRVRIVAGSLAAAVLLIAAGWTAHTIRHADHSTIAVAEGVRESSPGAILKGRHIEEPPRATFVGGPDVIVVPIESRHANVTIVRVYPTYVSSSSIQASADQPAWRNDLNGG